MIPWTDEAPVRHDIDAGALLRRANELGAAPPPEVLPDGQVRWTRTTDGEERVLQYLFDDDVDGGEDDPWWTRLVGSAFARFWV